MLDKDKPEVQRERISQIVTEVLADCEAVFDDKCSRVSCVLGSTIDPRER
jgi:hypothetical protein